MLRKAATKAYQYGIKPEDAICFLQTHGLIVEQRTILRSWPVALAFCKSVKTLNGSPEHRTHNLVLTTSSVRSNAMHRHQCSISQTGDMQILHLTVVEKGAFFKTSLTVRPGQPLFQKCMTSKLVMLVNFSKYLIEYLEIHTVTLVY